MSPWRYLTPEESARFEEDEAKIREDKEAANARRIEVREAKKRKLDAIEEAKVRLDENQAKANREDRNQLNFDLVSASNNPKIKICLTLLELLKETPIPVPATTQASA
ncbi:hypothetical protein DAPPUDRAFT_251474 [Daphnia pulex]|uniref:Uncharacterized protein n=1 Tax=Daphnia pulex TaxID=6669 RepID=E9H0I4_DAPPU|nr:hypothetical protein DAPPUDRAFT_251474 [Daphnia pulex]|eukprot:EFX74811.1 hypothetical protein DAPPUDRAFT_251474 [Daphnia pulex]